jgi:hypothetical protein
MTPFDRMDPERYPWPKRYDISGVNLRNLFVSLANPGAATNYPTHSLFNASTGPHVLVVRSMTYAGAAATAFHRLQRIRGALGTNLGNEVPVWAGERNPVGSHNYLDNVTQITPDFFITPGAAFNAGGVPNVVWSVLPPGWSLVWQNATTTGTVPFSFWWEELSIDDPWLGSVGFR